MSAVDDDPAVCDSAVCEDEREAVIAYFQSRIYGLDWATACGYYNQGFRKLKDIWKAKKLSDRNATAVFWRNHIMRPISREDIEIIKDRYLNKAMSRFGIKEWEITGDYRRGRDFDSKIRVILRSDRYDGVNADNFQRLFRRYIPDNHKGQPSILEKVIRGVFTFVFYPEGLGRAYLMEITICSGNFYYAMLLSTTGPKKFVDRVDAHIAKKYGRYHNLPNICHEVRIGKVRSEEELFQKLKIRYRPPNER